MSVAAASCHDPDKYFINPDTIESILALSSTLQTLPADGVSRTTITATIDQRTSPTDRQVKFKTTAGQLIAGTTVGKEVTVTADASGRAVADLQSETSVVTARIEAQLGTTGAIVRTLDVPFVAAPADSLFTVSAEPGSIPADGFARAQIRAQLRSAGGSLERTVRFATSAGTLYAPGVVAGTQVDVRADAGGVAIVELQSVAAVGTARVQVSALGATREVTVTFTTADPRNIISLHPDRSSAPADGATITQVLALVAPGVPATQRSVTFTTNIGSFGAEGTDEKTKTVTADTGNRAAVDLRSPGSAGTAVLRATVNNVSADARVLFTRALPERIQVSPDKTRISANGTDSTVVRATLLRDIGKVSPGTQVVFSATDANGQAIGTFAATTVTNADGLSTATFVPGNTAYRGLATIRVTVVDTSISGSATVEIIN